MVMFSVFLLVDTSVVLSSLRAGSGTAGSIGSQEDGSYSIVFLLLVALSVLIFPGLFCFVLCTESSQQSGTEFLREVPVCSLTTAPTHTSLSISKRKCVPWRAQVREGKQYQKHLENEDMENSHERFPEMFQEITALFNASHFCQTIFVSALNVSISVCAANLVIFNSRH